ncbi:MAG: hypothetical protein D3922_14415, partial [Candidatus Electrothrix sp. AR1]|nr:hypothetical protein [Candidatus Electrothrix sp. AR1]
MNSVEISKCQWCSPDRRFRCDRPVFSDSEYCLFHKPDKSKEEGELFWKVISYNPYLGIPRGELEQQEVCRCNNSRELQEGWMYCASLLTTGLDKKAGHAEINNKVIDAKKLQNFQESFQRAKRWDEKLKNAEINNFTKAEQESPEFDVLRKRVVDLFGQSKKQT